MRGFLGQGGRQGPGTGAGRTIVHVTSLGERRVGRGGMGDKGEKRAMMGSVRSEGKN